MEIACLDLEGVLVPEVWIAVAERTGIDELKLTTRDIADYNVLMRKRLDILAANQLTITDVQEVIATLQPLEGANAFLDWLRQHFQVVILSDTFYEFASPLMRQLEWPTLFCHRLDIDDGGRIVDFSLRQVDQKRKSVAALQGLNFRVLAAGDSYNDTTMLAEADAGILFCPPQNVIDEFPQFPVTRNYQELTHAFCEASVRALES
ncbi:MAG: bifunctional phosphoserine phosphatase/homoserine phosphotransferase ThrH [Pseudomonadota bacterium]